MGLLSVSVLNLNNIRDIENDKENNKMTIPVMIGQQNAKLYHAIIIIISIALLIFISSHIFEFKYQYLFLLPLLLLVFNIVKVYQIKNVIAYYPLLKQLSLSIMVSVFSIIIGYLF